MKPQRFAISVQYGGGLHYFISYQVDESIAQTTAHNIAKQAIALRKSRHNRGAVPLVYVWELKATFDGGFKKLPRKPRSSFPRSKKDV